MTEKNSLLAYVEAFSEAFSKLRALPTISDAARKAAFAEAFEKLTPQERVDRAFLFWFYGNQRDTQLNKSINQASAKKTALDNGRARGTSKRKAAALERRARIEDEVKRLFENSAEPIDKHGTLINELGNKQIARVVLDKIGNQSYSDSTFQKIVKEEVARQRKLKKERLGLIRPDLS